jgi:phage portal protein BeeE
MIYGVTMRQDTAGKSYPVVVNMNGANLETGDLARLFGAMTDRLSTSRAFSVQGWYRRCCDIRAKALADLPWVLHRAGQPGAVVWDVSTPVPEALSQAFGGLRRLLYMHELSLVLHGAAYAKKLRKGNRFTGLQYWNADLVSVEYEQQTGRVVQFRHGGEARPYRIEEVLHVFQPDPSVEVGPGSSDGQAARIHADVLDSLATFLDGYLDRGLTKATLLSVPPGTQKEDKDELKTWWRRLFGGKTRAGEVGILNNQVTVTTIGDGLKDLDNTGLEQGQRTALTTALGVPHFLVDSDAARMATAEADIRAFYLFTVLPQAMLLADAWNAQVLIPMGLSLSVDRARIEALQSQARSAVSEAVDDAGGALPKALPLVPVPPPSFPSPLAR